MKKVFSLLVFVFATLTFSFAQKIWNVNNLNSGVKSDFTTLQAAVDTADAGDIIYLHPSPTQYVGATIRKKLTIIGAGYDILANADSTGIRTYTTCAKTSSITIDQGGDNSTIIGLEINGCITLDSVANVAVQRNKISQCVSVNESHHIRINGNYFSGSSSQGNIDVNNNCNEIQVLNNTLTYLYSGSFPNVRVNASSIVKFHHNIFFGFISSSTSSFLYNIFVAY